MNNTVFEIIKITDKKGNDRIDGRYPIRIGRKCNVNHFGCGYNAYIHYIPKELGTLKVSEIEDIEENDDLLIFTTQNSIYHLKKLKEVTN